MEIIITGTRQTKHRSYSNFNNDNIKNVTCFSIRDLVLVRKEMDVDEHDTLSNITHHQVKKQRFHCCSAYHVHSMVFDNEQNSYHNMSVKRLIEEFEDTKGEIRIRITKKNRQHNGRKKKYKRTNNDLQTYT